MQRNNPYSSKYEITRASYDTVVGEFAEKHSDVNKIVPLMLPFTERLPQAAMILDAGCGPGRDAKVFISQGYTVVGVDFSREMLRLASSVKGLETKLSDLRNIDYRDQSFDGIWANASLHHFDQKDVTAALSEFSRLLKPGGILFVAVKRGRYEGFTEEYPACPRFYGKYSLNDVRHLVGAFDLNVIKSATFTGEHKLPGWAVVYATKPTDKQLLLDFGCKFCHLIDQTKDNPSSQLRGLPLWDRPLHISSHFVVFPGLGHLMEGYMLVVSREHILSMGELSHAGWDDFQRVTNKVKQILEPEFGPIVLFEHGSTKGGPASGSSITHAHIHAVPASQAFLESVIRSLPFTKVHARTFAHASSVAQKSYLLIDAGDGKCFGCHPDTDLPSQYLRRHLAHSVGKEGCWDWHYYPFDECALLTFKRLRARYGTITF